MANQQPDPEIVKLEGERARLKQGIYRSDSSEHDEKTRTLTERGQNIET